MKRDASKLNGVRRRNWREDNIEKREKKAEIIYEGVDLPAQQKDCSRFVTILGATRPPISGTPVGDRSCSGFLGSDSERGMEKKKASSCGFVLLWVS